MVFENMFELDYVLVPNGSVDFDFTDKLLSFNRSTFYLALLLVSVFLAIILTACNFLVSMLVIS